jgi:hypothetical protein
MDKQKLIQEIFKLGLKIHLKYELCVWVDMAGHVNQIRVEMTKDHNRYKDKIYSSSIYFDYPHSKGELETEVNILKQILKTGELKNIPVHMDRNFKTHKSQKATVDFQS